MPDYDYVPEDDTRVPFPVPKKRFEDLMEYQKALWRDESRKFRIRKNLLRNSLTFLVNGVGVNLADFIGSPVYTNLWPTWLKIESRLFVVDYYSTQTWDFYSKTFGACEINLNAHFNAATGVTATRDICYDYINRYYYDIHNAYEDEFLNDFIIFKTIAGPTHLYKNDYCYQVKGGSGNINWFHREGISKILTEKITGLPEVEYRKMDFGPITPPSISQALNPPEIDPYENYFNENDPNTYTENKFREYEDLRVIFTPQFRKAAGVKSAIFGNLFVVFPLRLKPDIELTARLWDQYPETLGIYVVLTESNMGYLTFYLYNTWMRAQYVQTEQWQTIKPFDIRYILRNENRENQTGQGYTTKYKRIQERDIYWYNYSTWSSINRDEYKPKGQWQDWDELPLSKKRYTMGLTGVYLSTDFSQIITGVFLSQTENLFMNYKLQ